MTLPSPCNIYLLSTIVAVSERLLNQKYTNHPEAKALLEEHGELNKKHGKQTFHSHIQYGQQP
jgi:hypothetical protein